MEQEKKQELENLLGWCEEIQTYWKSAKPGFQSQLDSRSVDDWEESYGVLKTKLHADLNENFDHKQRAMDLYDELKAFHNECVLDGWDEDEPVN